MFDAREGRVRSKSAAIFVVLLSLLCGCVGTSAQTMPHQGGQKNGLPIDLNQPWRSVSTESRACSEGDWAFLDSKTTRALLADYGFEFAPPFTCVEALVPWLPLARILRVNEETIRLDDYREFTIIQGTRESQIWVIPIEYGMVMFSHVEDDPHNIAAFNDLLRVATRKPDENLLLELGNLYQFIVGAEEWFDPSRMPKTVEDSLKINDLWGTTERDADGITYKHREFYGDKWTHAYMVWEFDFRESKDGLRLASVERGPLDPVTDDIKYR